MGDEIVFSTASKCFASIDRDAWNALTQGAVWADFLDASRRLLQQGAKLGEDESPASRAHPSCPLQDFLSVGEVNALFAPPSWEDARSFATLHFTGGLPASAPPVESLYRLPDGSVEPCAPCGASGLPGSYCGEPARYMRGLVKRMGLSLPPEFADCPDHLSIELDLLAVLLRSGMTHQAREFLSERFAWLPAYRLRLLELEDDPRARFYVGLVDVLLGVWLQQTANAASGRPSSAI